MENECNHELKSKTINNGCKIYCSKCNFSAVLTNDMNVIITENGKDFIELADNASGAVWLFGIFLLIAKNEDVCEKLKNFKPKYNNIELIIDEGNKFFITMLTIEKVKQEFPEYEIESVKDYEDTKTTSIIIKEER